jgi:hypothetical protein
MWFDGSSKDFWGGGFENGGGEAHASCCGWEHRIRSPATR